MSRSISGAVAMLALIAATPALAADYQELRPSYPENWETTTDNQLRFEAGVRYWYSWGAQNARFAPTELTVRDNTHILEVHGRIDDLSTQTYVKALGGLGVKTSGTYTLTPGSETSIGDSSRVGYLGGDFGWMPFGNMSDGVAVGGLVGYQYWNDSPDIGRGDFVTAIGPDGVPTGGDSAVDNLDVHALRLGLRGTAEVSDMFDVQAEVAAVPYAWVTGTLGPHELEGVPVGGNTLLYKSSPTSLAGTGYGAMGEVMVGFHPTENLTVRFGGRAWYLEGALDATFDSYLVTDADNDPATDPVITQQRFIQASDFANIFRYGALFELTGRF